MKKFILQSAFVLGLIVILTSCSNDNNDDMTPDPPNNTTEITYTKNVKAIIDSKCLSCHKNPPINSAPMALTSFNDVKNSTQTRGLINRIKDGTMPPDGTLTATQIKTIEDWQEGGYIE